MQRKEQNLRLKAIELAIRYAETTNVDLERFKKTYEEIFNFLYGEQIHTGSIRQDGQKPRVH